MGVEILSKPAGPSRGQKLARNELVAQNKEVEIDPTEILKTVTISQKPVKDNWFYTKFLEGQKLVPIEKRHRDFSDVLKCNFESNEEITVCFLLFFLFFLYFFFFFFSPFLHPTGSKSDDWRIPWWFQLTEQIATLSWRWIPQPMSLALWWETERRLHLSCLVYSYGCAFFFFFFFLSSVKLSIEKSLRRSLGRYAPSIFQDGQDFGRGGNGNDGQGRKGQNLFSFSPKSCYQIQISQKHPVL